jgi:hypothetical protein
MTRIQQLRERYKSICTHRDRCAEHPPSEHRDFYMLILGEAAERLRMKIKVAENKEERAA